MERSYFHAACPVSGTYGFLRKDGYSFQHEHGFRTGQLFERFQRKSTECGEDW